MSDGLQSERLLQEADVSRFGLALWVLLFAFPALAQAPAEEPHLERYRTVVHARPRRDRNPAIVITARELVERGIDNLSEALDLVPQLGVRQGGRGDVRVDVRGAKQRSVLVLVDGAPMDEPYFGAFDLASIPVTDIVEIRVTLAPASPLEGPGGDGGIVEVITLRAVGAKRIDARARASSQPDAQAALSARTPIAGGLAARGSAGGRYGAQDFALTNPGGTAGTLGQPQHQAHGAVRLEHESRWTLSSADGWISHRSFWSPPTENGPAALTFVRSDLDARVIAGVQLTRGTLRLAAGLYSQWIVRDSDSFHDGLSLLQPFNREHLSANRTGAAVHADYGLRRSWQLSARASIDAESATIHSTIGMPGGGKAIFGELAVGALGHWRWFCADAAVGLAAPLGNATAPWPEAKLMVTYNPNPWFQLRATGARKGRLPTLRELHDPLTGNPNLSPEQTWFGELALLLKPNDLVAARMSGWVRHTDGLIQLDVETHTHSVNYDSVDARGFETGIEVATGRQVWGGATYVFEDAYQPRLGVDAINNFPRHKLDAWAAARMKNLAGALARFRHVGERIDQGVRLPGYQQLDLSGWLRLSREVKATLRVDNVTDNRYQARAGVSAIGRVIGLAIEGVWE